MCYGESMIAFEKSRIYLFLFNSLAFCISRFFLLSLLLLLKRMFFRFIKISQKFKYRLVSLKTFRNEPTTKTTKKSTAVKFIPYFVCLCFLIFRIMAFRPASIDRISWFDLWTHRNKLNFSRSSTFIMMDA